jgi:hypothetical protein
MSRERDSKIIEVSLFLHYETDKALLLSETGEKKDAVWVPKSQVENYGDGTYGMKESLAIEKGFV